MDPIDMAAYNFRFAFGFQDSLGEEVVPDPKYGSLSLGNEEVSSTKQDDGKFKVTYSPYKVSLKELETSSE